jgi:Dual OB-containing domain
VAGRTRMPADRVCVGGLTLDSGTSVRLLGSDGRNLPEDHRIRPGDVWDLTYSPRTATRPPHTEDVIVASGRPVRTVENIKASILELIDPWDCELDGIFDGQLAVTEHGTAFLRDDPPLPGSSTGFWIADRPVRLAPSGYGARYRFSGDGWLRRADTKPTPRNTPVRVRCEIASRVPGRLEGGGG